MNARVEIPAYAAAPALLAILGAAYLTKPAELRRSPVLEAQGLVGIAPKYEVMYANCTDGKDKATLDAKGLAKGLVGGYAHKFPAMNDKDAIAFVKAARPQCRVLSLNRLHYRTVGQSSSGRRYRRERIDVY